MRATEDALWVAGVGALLSFVSIVLVLVALNQTRRANRISMRESARSTVRAVAAARNAQDALTHARESSWKQLRPYIGIEAITHGYVAAPNLLPVTSRYEIAITLKNYGVTPGYVVIGVGVVIWNVGNPDPILADATHFYGFKLLPSQTERVYVPVEMFADRRDDIEDCKSAMLLFTQIDYENGEKGRDFSRQKFRADGDIFKAGRMDEANNNREA